MSSNFDLTGLTACVTGASSGIGQGLASGLARAGAHVIGIARRQDALDVWQAEMAGDGLRVSILSADLSDAEKAEACGAAVLSTFGAPDILINAAGVNPRKPADTISPEVWQATLDLNLTVPFFLARAFVPAMREKGWGKILNIASLQTSRAMPDGIAYGASKAGIAQVTRAMAEAWSKDGIGCNALAPGFFSTALTAPVFANADAVQALADKTCIGRNGVVEDLVGPALFFCSKASDYVTGQVLYVDGGFTAK